MSYSQGKKAFKRVEQFLTQMLATGGRIEFVTKDSGRLAYHIREGIHAAKYFPELSSYATLSGKFIVKANGGVVTCEPRTIVPVVAPTMGYLSIPDVRDALGILGACIKHKFPMMVFPDADPDLDVTMLERWANGNGYKVIVTDIHITVERKESE